MFILPSNLIELMATDTLPCTSFVDDASNHPKHFIFLIFAFYSYFYGLTMFNFQSNFMAVELMATDTLPCTSFVDWWLDASNHPKHFIILIFAFYGYFYGLT